MHRLKISGFIVLFILSNKLFAQQIDGQVLDSSTKLPLENVVLSYGLKTAVTGLDGAFKLTGIKLLGVVKIHKLGYEDYELNLNNVLPNVKVYLQAVSIDLKDVTISSKRDYIADSLKLRKDYANVFAFKAPTIKDVLVEKGLRYKTPGSNLVSNSTSSIISLDVLKTIGLFTKSKSSISKLQKVQLKEEETNYINHRFDPEKISSITKLEGDSLKNFIEKYRPSVEQIREMNDYEVLMYVKKSYGEFIKPNKD